MDTKFKRGDALEQQDADGNWCDVGTFQRYEDDEIVVLFTMPEGFYVETELLEPHRPIRIKPQKEYESPRAAFDDWRNNSHHASGLGGDPMYHENPETGENNGDEMFIRHEAFAAFRAGMRYAATGSPFKQK